MNKKNWLWPMALGLYVSSVGGAFVGGFALGERNTFDDGTVHGLNVAKNELSNGNADDLQIGLYSKRVMKALQEYRQELTATKSSIQTLNYGRGFNEGFADGVNKK